MSVGRVKRAVLTSVVVVSIAVGCGRDRTTGMGRGFGEPCEVNADCASNVCLELSLEKVCSTPCASDCECPSGFACASAGGGLSVCAPGDNPCVDPPSPPPDVTAIDLAFDPSNLGGWVHGKALGTVPDVEIGCTDCDCELPVTIDTDTGSFICGGHFEVFTQDGAPSPSDTLGVFFMRSLSVTTGEDGGAITVRGSRPAVLVVQGRVDLDAGRWDVTAGGWPAPRRIDGAAFGNGPGGGAYSTRTFGGGAEGGSHCSLGGLGAQQAARGGRTYGNAEITPLMGGSSGATTGTVVTADPGDGGGALQIVAGEGITIGPRTTIVVSGGRGYGLSEGSGGGSGGALLLEAPEIAVNGALLVEGGDGGVLPGAGAQGTMEAENGGEEPGSRWGGGGGGFGWIRINTQSGTASIAIDSILSPVEGHRCMTFGPLRARTEPPAPAMCDAATLPSAECGTCLAASCCAEIQRCEAEELCSTCRTSATPGPGCASDPSLAAIAECTETRCPSACP